MDLGSGGVTKNGCRVQSTARKIVCLLRLWEAPDQRAQHCAEAWESFYVSHRPKCPASHFKSVQVAAIRSVTLDLVGLIIWRYFPLPEFCTKIQVFINTHWETAGNPETKRFKTNQYSNNFFILIKLVEFTVKNWYLNFMQHSLCKARYGKLTSNSVNCIFGAKFRY